jgi:hypothetical protein
VSRFSDFIRNATPEEKEAVYMDVMKKATERQNAVTAPSAPLPERRVDARLLPNVLRGDAVIVRNGNTELGDVVADLNQAADEIDALRARLRNQAAQITGRHQYVGQDYEFRIERLTERAEAAESRAAALQKELEAAHRAMEWSITDIAIHMPDGPAKDEALARIKAITRKRADAALSKESPDE